MNSCAAFHEREIFLGVFEPPMGTRRCRRIAVLSVIPNPPPFLQPAAAKVEKGSVWPCQDIGAGPNSIPVFAALKVKIVDPLLLELLPDSAQVTTIVLRG